MKPKKSLGQNFFNNETLAKKIVNTTFFVSQERTVEIGPGNGFFTSMFHDLCNDIVVIEKDDELAKKLQLRFKDIHVINSDILNIDLKTLKTKKRTVVFGSLPYNISKVIIRNFVSSKLFDNFFFIVQKEVARKYLDSQKTSLQYLTTKYYVDTKLIFDINPGSFTPRPKVQSSFIHMSANENDKKCSEKLFLRTCKEAFKSPRKTLRNNLKTLFKDIEAPLFDKRAEDLSFDEFCELASNLKMI